MKHSTDGLGVGKYIRDRIINSGWDQTLLQSACPQCNNSNAQMRITYQFPKRKTDVLQVLHMVGLVYPEDPDYVPMLWETANLSRPDESLFQFNYILGKNVMGLRTAAVLGLEEIKGLLELYREKTGKALPFKFSTEMKATA